MWLVLLGLYTIMMGLICSFAWTMLRHRQKPLEDVLGIWHQGLRRQLGSFLLYGIIGFILAIWIVNR